MFLLLAPLKGVLWVVEQIHDQVLQELYSEDAVRRELVALRLQLEMGEIEAPAYAEAEGRLLARLREVRLQRLAELGGDHPE
jgi:ribosomal protein L29